MDSPLWLLVSPAGAALAFVWGALWGSFVNVVAVRVPRGESVVRPGSRCMSCGAPIRAIDNVPIVSYVVRRGRCRSCGARFSPRYLAVELASALLALGAFQIAVVAGGDPVAARLARFLVYHAFAAVLLALSCIDLDTKLIPDRITYPAIPLAYLAGRFLSGDDWRDVGWRDGAIGAAAGYLFVRLLADGYYHLTRREGLGYGDGKLLALVGALLGWQALPLTLFVGSLIGSTLGVLALVVARRRTPDPAAPRLRHTELPFGPFLALGALTYLFFGERYRALLDALSSP